MHRTQPEPPGAMHGRAEALALLNPWQRDFPLQREPFAPIAAALGSTVTEVLAAYARLLRGGALSRIGGVFAPAAGGAALLAAMAVPPERLAMVAARVSAHAGVNHNYQREHQLNLWFVMTGHDRTEVEQAMQVLEWTTGLPALRLRMQRAYHIDLGFDLRHQTATQTRSASRPAGAPVAAADRSLAALVEAGLPLLERPYDAWAEALGRTPDEVMATLHSWLETGTLKRFGAIVRHHELGFAANAMTVFDVPDAQVDACGEALARQPGITLAYRRERALAGPQRWPYNLYCMVHGRDRETVHAVLARAIAGAGLADLPRQVLFSLQRYKQTGARRFREAVHPAQDAGGQQQLPAMMHAFDPTVLEARHAVA